MRKSSGAKRSGKVSESKKPDFKKNESGKSFSSENKPAPKFSRTDKPKPQVVKIKSDKEEIRLNKYVANSGVCSRRDADIYIQSGNVKVNGEVVTEMGHKVKLTDVVNFDGVNITPEKKEYILLIVSIEIGSPFANWFALNFPTGVPQLPQPLSSAYFNAALAFDLTPFG